MQFENINPQLIESSNPFAPGFVDARIPLTMASWHMAAGHYDADRLLVPDEVYTSTTSSIIVTLDGSDLPASPFLPQLRAGPVDVNNARGLRHRTPWGGTKGASTRPGMLWTWEHFPDEFWNVDIQPDVLDNLVMSDLTLMTDFSGQARLFPPCMMPGLSAP